MQAMTCNALYTLRPIIHSIRTVDTPTLSFLYQTSTILRPWKRNASRTSDSRFARPSRGSAKQQRVAALKARNSPAINTLRLPSTGSSVAKSIDKTISFSPNQYRDDAFVATKENDNIFAKILQELPIGNVKRHEETPSPRGVTMTQAEHEIFERLQALSTKSKPKRIDRDDPEDEFDKPASGPENLEQLFDEISVTLKQEKPVEKDTKSRLETYYAIEKDKQEKRDQSRRSRLWAVGWPQTVDDELPQYRLTPPGTNGKGIKVSFIDRESHISEFQQALSKAETDIELWQRLDKEVFKMMRDLNSSLKDREVSRGKEVVPIGKGKNKPAGQAAKTQLSQMVNTPSLQERARLQTVTSMYGPGILYGTRLLRVGFPNSSYSEMILPTIKKLGPISYVLAASTALYNELLYMRWESFRDLNGCASLVEEMISQNILADRHTALVYQAAKDTRDYELGITKRNPTSLVLGMTDKHVPTAIPLSPLPDLDWSQQGTKYIPFGTRIKSFKEGYWRLQGTEAAWLRWTKAYNRLVAMTRQELQRKKNEQEDNIAMSDAAKQQTDDQQPDGHASVNSDRGKETDMEPEVEILPDENLTGSVMMASERVQDNISVA